MKRRIYLILTAALAFVTSCEQNEFPLSASSFSDVSFINSQISDEFGSIFVDVGSAVNFMDLSQGAISHVWQISSDKAYFLEGDYSVENTDFSNNIVSGDISTEKIVGVLFNEPGDSPVRLYNVFNDFVSYTGYEGNTKVTTNSEWNEDLGAYVFDYTTDFIVVDSVRVGYIVKDWNGEELLNIALDEWDSIVANSSTWKEVEVPAGKSLTFTVSDDCDASRYDGITWTLTNGSPLISPSLTSKELTATYAEATTSYVNAGQLKLSRSTGTNSNFKFTAGSCTKKIPLRIKVVEPTEEFAVSSVSSNSGDNYVTIPLGVIVAGDDIVLDINDFQISGTDYYGNALTLNIESVEFTDLYGEESDDEVAVVSDETGDDIVEETNYYTSIIVTFGESQQIYADDNIVLSYTQGATQITDIFDRALQDFEVAITPEVTDYTAAAKNGIFSFEDRGEFNAQSTHKAFYLSTEEAYDGATSLHYSLANFNTYCTATYTADINMYYNVGSTATNMPVTFDTGKVYICKFKLFLRSGFGGESLLLQTKHTSTVKFSINYEFDTEDSRNWNKWQDVEVTMDMTGTSYTNVGESFDSYLSFIFTNKYGVTTPADVEFFIDDLSVSSTSDYREKDSSDVVLDEFENGGSI